MTDFTAFTELFPVRSDALPKLHAYQPTTTDAAHPRTATRLAREHGGKWAFADGLILTDSPPRSLADAALDKVKRYKPTPVALAEFVIHALIPPLSDNLYHALQTPLNGSFRVLQRPLFKGWAVNGEPALSIGIAQTLIYRQTLAEYATSIPDVRGLTQMTVITRSPMLDYRLVQGIVATVPSTVGEQRQQLERFAKTNAAQRRLSNAPDHEPVVTMMTPFGQYQYPASELYITLTPKDYVRLRVDAEAAKQASYQDIDERARAVAAASAVLKAMDLIGDAYRADKSPGMFMTAVDLGFSAQVALGDGLPRPYAPRKIWTQMREVGMFAAHEQPEPLTIGILDAIGDGAETAAAAVEAATSIGVRVDGVESLVTPKLTASAVEKALKQLSGANTLIALLPRRSPTATSPISDWDTFINVKRVALDAGMFSLCLYEPDLRTPPKELSMAFGQMLGHTPFALGEPLPFTDFVVGLVRAEKATAVHVYDNTGRFIGYITHKGKLGVQATRKLLPEAFFKGTRLVVQTLTPLTDDELTIFTERAATLDVTLHMSTVSAGANPNLYAFANKAIKQPPTGTAFLMDENRALFVPAMPAHPKAPANPLLIETGARFPVEMGLRTVLAMNTLHATARKPRLPLHLIHNTAIKRLLDAEVYPTPAEGAFMWWR